ncbi:MAG: VWA-like domain-containing protein, partial [Candidatus Odinarchaeota archaeon]
VDIVTNEILVRNKIGKPPKKVVRGEQFLSSEFYEKDGLINKSAEEIYRELASRAVKVTEYIEQNGSPNFDQHYEPGKQQEDQNGGEKSNSEIAKAFKKIKRSVMDWKSRLAQASVYAKSRGRVPFGIEEEYELVIKGYFPWQRLLAQYIQQSLAYDTTFTRPNRRYVSRDLYLPATEKSGINIVVAIDTSGSIGEEEAKVFIGETFAILSQFQRVEITVIQCDAAVQEVKHYSNWDVPPAKFKMKGRGGTDFRPVFDHVEKEKVPMDVLIYLTDGYGTFPEKQPYQVPVFWVLTTRNVNPPFGRKVFFPPLSRF